MEGKGSRFFGTLNNYTEEDLEKFTAFHQDSKCLSMVAFYEVGSQGTPHIQFCLALTGPMRFKALNKKLGNRCNLEKMKGTWEQAAKYCRKGSGVAEAPVDPKPFINDKVDVPGGQGTRNDIAKFRDQIRSGMCNADLLDEAPNQCARFTRFIDFVRTAYAERDLRDLPLGEKEHIGHWIVGVANVGKTTWVKQQFDPYIKPHDKWWSKYEFQPNVLIDDPPDHWAAILYGHLKTWVNETKVTVEVKGSSMTIRPSRFFICSNSTPEEYFAQQEGKRAYFEPGVFNSRFTVHKPQSRAELEALVIPRFTAPMNADEDDAAAIEEQDEADAPLLVSSDDDSDGGVRPLSSSSDEATWDPIRNRPKKKLARTKVVCIDTTDEDSE
jgi:hypothetical protein